MSALLCCLRARRHDMGAALSLHTDGDSSDATNGVATAPPTMADVIRERKKKAGGAVGTLKRRLVNAARRPRDARPDRGCEHARYLRSVVSGWRLAEVFVLCEELDALAALRDLATQADLAREPATHLNMALPQLLVHSWWCDVQVVGAGWSISAHRAVLAARSHYFRDLLHRQPPGSGRVVLEGSAAQLPREAARAALLAMYGATDLCVCNKYGSKEIGEMDLGFDVDTLCGCAGWPRCEVRRVCAALGATNDPLHVSMRYLLDSGELCDCRLVFRVSEGAQFGFRAALELPAHRVVLAARSRVLRSVLSRAGSSGCVCVDEAVLPRRFAKALLHAAYTDQVDLTLIGRNSSSPSSSVSERTSGASAWSGVGRGSSRAPAAAALDDAFQLYEIARFLEMPIVVQGCEDAIVEALCADTLPQVLRWAAAPHASQWVQRQAMRYLRDEFLTIMSSAYMSLVPGEALREALASPFLQAGEAAALRLVLRWAASPASTPPSALPPLSTIASSTTRGPDARLRDRLAPLLPLLRLEHLPHDHELLQQLIRRGVVPAEYAVSAEASSADRWLGRGSYRTVRCFMPYLDEIKALLEDQAIPEEEVARARRARYVNKIPDTLYMVCSARGSPPPTSAASAVSACSAVLSARALAALHARVRELAASPAALRAAKHPHHADQLRRQLALRAVRERSLPDSCADLLMQEPMPDHSDEMEGDRSPERDELCHRDECCEHSAVKEGGSVRCASTASLRSAATLHIPIDNISRAGTCRREQSSRRDSAHHRSWSSECGRLSAAVPDVAMAPNANTHLLTPRDYFRHPAPWEYGGVVLQLDLGDGATHTPRPGSRAQRNSGASTTRQRDYAQALCARGAALEPLASHRATLPHYAHTASSAHSSRHEPPAPTHLPRGSACPSPSPRHHRHYPLHPHEYRLDPSYGSASTSRGHSPNNYA